MKKRKVIFVEPRGAHFNVYDKFMSIPLLGPIYLATIAEQNGYEVSVINENILGRKINSEELKDADVLCLSCITATIDRGREIANDYRKIRKKSGLEAKTLIGGIHASMLPEDVVSDFDQVVVGEAENIISDILSGRNNEKIIYAEKPTQLDTLPFLNFKLIKGWEKMNILSIMTSRGCPYDCNFCSVTKMFGKAYRNQSPERVLDEILRYEKGKIFFSDDYFAADMKRTNKMLDMMISTGFSLPWSTQVRTEVTKKPRFVKKMKKAGCTTVYVGLESINPKALVEMNKKQNVKDIERTIKVFHDKGIEVHGMFILGNDSDTKEVFERTSDFSIRSGLDYAQYSILTPLPGSRTYFQFEKDKRLLHKNWRFYDGLHVVFKPKNMTPDELQEGAIKCFRNFYSYSRAIKSALKTTINAIVTPIKKAYKEAYFPSLTPALMRAAGKKIIDNWIEYNSEYLNFLRDLKYCKKRKAV